MIGLVETARAPHGSAFPAFPFHTSITAARDAGGMSMQPTHGGESEAPEGELPTVIALLLEDVL